MMSAEAGRVYSVEHRLDWMLDNASDGAPIRVYGSDWYPEREVKFNGVQDVQRYCDRVTAFVGANSVRVRERKGDRRATYCAGVIAIPTRNIGSEWALRERVVLHELAHHLARVDGHGKGFRLALDDLLVRTGHPITARLLSIMFAEEGLASTM